VCGSVNTLIQCLLTQLLCYGAGIIQCASSTLIHANSAHILHVSGSANIPIPLVHQSAVKRYCICSIYLWFRKHKHFSVPQIIAIWAIWVPKSLDFVKLLELWFGWCQDGHCWQCNSLIQRV